jgi:predicted RNA-binding protein with PUA-like domain
MKSYWLFKSEPGSWSWDQQKKAGNKGEPWTGVRNFQARRNMREMKVGDEGFFYHTGDDKEIVGIVEVVRTVHPDHTDKTGQWECVDLRAVRDFPKPVTIAAVKAEPKLRSMTLVRNSRLSVQPVTAEEWRTVCSMGGLGRK